jgi:hypothetical protein
MPSFASRSEATTATTFKNIGTVISVTDPIATTSAATTAWAKASRALPVLLLETATPTIKTARTADTTLIHIGC